MNQKNDKQEVETKVKTRKRSKTFLELEKKCFQKEENYNNLTKVKDFNYLKQDPTKENILNYILKYYPENQRPLRVVQAIKKLVGLKKKRKKQEVIYIVESEAEKQKLIEKFKQENKPEPTVEIKKKEA